MPKYNSKGTREQRIAVRKMLKELNFGVGDHLSMENWYPDLDGSFKRFFDCDDNGIPKYLRKRDKPY